MFSICLANTSSSEAMRDGTNHLRKIAILKVSTKMWFGNPCMLLESKWINFLLQLGWGLSNTTNVDSTVIQV